MTFAHVTAGSVDQVGPLPDVYYDGTRWWDLRGGGDVSAAGWFRVVVVPRPADTATTTVDYSVGLVGGVPSDVWTPRAKTPAEIAAATAAANETTITDQLRAVIDALIASRATIKSTALDPTNATINSNPAAVIKALAKAVRDDEQTLIRVCRLLARQLDSADAGAAVSAP